MTAERILVRGPNWLGDLVMATPGFRALRGAFPDSEIVLHARAEHLALFAASKCFDRCLPVRSYHRGPSALVREGRGLRPRGYDLGICLPDSTSSALLMRLACRGTVVGYRRRGSRWLLDRAPAPPPPMTPRERHVLGVIAAAAPACDRGDTRVALELDGEAEERAEGFLQDSGLAARDLVLLAPGASYGPSKLWPARHFAAVADALAEHAAIAVIGTPGEASLCEALCEAADTPILNFAGRLELPVLLGVIARARLLICNDAGARHLATALGRPCVVLFGPTSVEKTALNLERVEVIEGDAGCRPCYHRICPIDHRCLRDLAPERVVRAAESILAGSPQEGAS